MIVSMITMERGRGKGGRLGQSTRVADAGKAVWRAIS